MTIPGEEARLEVARAEGRARLRAGIYTRMSIAAIGDTTKVDDQERICRDLAARVGADVVDVYCDNNRSAWARNRKRKDWDRLLVDIDAGRINCVLPYHGDRLIRQPWDLEILLQRAELKGIRIISPTGARDLDNADDRFILRIEAAQACRESDNTSRRRKAQYERWRREGKVRPGGRGGRAYGFATDGVTVIEAEAAVIKDMAARVLAGEGAGAIARAASAAGARTPTGAEFSHGTVRKMLARPRYAGLMPDGESNAAWEAILDRETWELVRAALEGRAAGYSYATNARKWLLSGIARCSECDGPMQVKPSKGRGRAEYATGYSCVTKGCGRAYRSAAHLDAYVSAAVVAYLAHPRGPAPEAPGDPGRAAEWEALHRQRAEAEELLADPAGGAAAILVRRIARIDERIAALRELAGSGQQDRLLSQYQGATLPQFRELPLDVRRALVAAAVTVTVLPASRRGPGFRPEDVRVLPVQG